MIQIRHIDNTEKSYWNKEIQRFDSVHPLNAYDWGTVRSTDGWTPIYLVAERDNEMCGAMMILVKKLPVIPASILYSPKGPIWNQNEPEVLTALINKSKEIAKKNGAIFMRIDPNIPEAMITSDDPFVSLGLIHLDQRWTFWTSPRDVYRINLSVHGSSEELFNRLDRDTRRCIRKAEKEGVTIEIGTNEDHLKAFYEIFKQFSVGKGFMSRDYEYQKKLWEAFTQKDMGRLFLAKYNERIIGGLICIKFGSGCLAMHMGTPYQYHKLQTNYAYIWASIKWAKESGCSWYSFRGVGTTPSQEYFKSKFLPEVVSLVGYYDLPFRRLLYKLFYFLEFIVLPKAFPYLISVRKKFHRGIGEKNETTD